MFGRSILGLCIVRGSPTFSEREHLIASIKILRYNIGFEICILKICDIYANSNISSIKI